MSWQNIRNSALGDRSYPPPLIYNFWLEQGCMWNNGTCTHGMVNRKGRRKNTCTDRSGICVNCQGSVLHTCVFHYVVCMCFLNRRASSFTVWKHQIIGEYLLSLTFIKYILGINITGVHSPGTLHISRKNTMTRTVKLWNISPMSH